MTQSPINPDHPLTHPSVAITHVLLTHLYSIHPTHPPWANYSPTHTTNLCQIWNPTHPPKPTYSLPLSLTTRVLFTAPSTDTMCVHNDGMSRWCQFIEKSLERRLRCHKIKRFLISILLPQSRCGIIHLETKPARRTFDHRPIILFKRGR